MSSLIGQTLGRYHILEEIGTGGMGVVYRAHDERLGRDLALKVLAPGTLDDPVARKRFRQEAKVLSRLNHPAIQTIHDFDTLNGLDYIVTELVPGTTLSTRLSSGPLRERDVVHIGLQLAQGLGASHAEGILHRDLKPDNLRITPDERLKILDFGLATLSRPGACSMTTATSFADTSSGGGTLPYMSPEQLLGDNIDERSDIYSAGAVLYEMATGHRAFAGSNATRLINSILHELPPAPRSIDSGISPELERIILKCLDKDRENRYQSARELAVDLRRIDRAATAPHVPAAILPPRSRHHGIFRLALAAGTVATVVFVVVWILTRRAPDPTPTTPLKMVPITAFTDSATSAALSPDGKMLAFIRGPGTFVTPGQIYVKLLPSGEPVQLTHDHLGKMAPAFSPDGSRIAYTVFTDTGSWDTWTVPVLGGEARQWLVNGSGLHWIGARQLLFSEISPVGSLHMNIVSSDETRADTRTVYSPENIRGMAHSSMLSPDGKWVILTEMLKGMLPCRLLPFDGSSRGRAAGPATGKCTSAAWSPDGQWMYFASNASGTYQLWRQRFPNGEPQQLTFGPTEAEGIAVAPDGRSLISSVGLAQSSVWLHDSAGDRQISSEGNALLPVWGDGQPRSVFSPDGKKIYYLVQTGGMQSGFGGGELWVRDVSGGAEEPVLPGVTMSSYDISTDGKRLVYAGTGPDMKPHLWVAPLDRSAAPIQIFSGESIGPVFGANNDIYFRGFDGKFWCIYNVNIDSAQVRKFSDDPVTEPPMVSPEGQWIVDNFSSTAGNKTAAAKAYPASGGAPRKICEKPSLVKWTRDGKAMLLAFVGGSKTYLIPLAHGKSLPPLPPNGFSSEDDILKLTGVRVIDDSSAFPGITASVWAYTRSSVHRNLYRITLP